VLFILIKDGIHLVLSQPDVVVLSVWSAYAVEDSRGFRSLRISPMVETQIGHPKKLMGLREMKYQCSKNIHLQ
jgi:hypothetical protein